MSRGYGAEVFNQPEERFHEAAEAIWFDPAKEEFMDFLMPMKNWLEISAPGLNNYLSLYQEDVVKPFNRNIGKEPNESGITDEELIFSAASYMTFKMVQDVSDKAGMELPFLGSGIIRDFTKDTVIPASRNTPLINYHFRGSELKKKLPHVYRPVLNLMRQVAGEEPAAIDADLSMAVRDHETMGIERAMAELHFVGGAAETVLAIEELAPAPERRSPISQLLLKRSIPKL